MKRQMNSYRIYPLNSAGFNVNLIDIDKDCFWKVNDKTFFRTSNMRDSVEIKNKIEDSMSAYDVTPKLVEIRSTTDMLFDYQKRKK